MVDTHALNRRNFPFGDLGHMESVTAITPTSVQQAEPPARRLSRVRDRRGLWWWLPVALVAAYAVVLAAELPTVIAHTWWSADSASAGLLAELYRQPPPGQYIVLGNHGWYEVLAFDLLTRGLPAHRLLWYAMPVVVWVSTLALIGASAGRAFGRYGAALAVGGLLLVAPAGLMVVFQPTAHTNVVFHAAALAAVAGWVLPRIRTLPLPVTLATGVLIGAFTGLALAGDAIALAWAVLPFAVAIGVCAMRGSAPTAARTLAFALATLTAMLAASVLLTGIMRSAGFRVDQFAQSAQMHFVKADALASNAGKTVNELAYLVGGSFLGQRIDLTGGIELVSGGLLLLGGVAVALAAYRSAVAAGWRGRAADITPRLVHVAFWSTCLGAGLLMFLLSSVGSVDYRYLLGPLAAIGALLPVVAARGRHWRILVGVGLSVMALAGLVRLDIRRLPYLPLDVPLAQRDMAAITRFAHRHHATFGFANYWDAVEISWNTRLAVNLHPVIHCGQRHGLYCSFYHADAFTAAYIPRRGLRTLFVADTRYQPTQVKSWGRPLATERVGRLTLYAYPDDIARRFPAPRPGEIQSVITGRKLPNQVGPTGRASWATF